MAQFQGFTCDSCGKVVAAEERTKRTVRMEGPRFGNGQEYHEDLCPDCVAVPEGVKLRDIPRRKKVADEPDPDSVGAA